MEVVEACQSWEIAALVVHEVAASVALHGTQAWSYLSLAVPSCSRHRKAEARRADMVHMPNGTGSQFGDFRDEILEQ